MWRIGVVFTPPLSVPVQENAQESRTTPVPRCQRCVSHHFSLHIYIYIYVKYVSTSSVLVFQCSNNFQVKNSFMDCIFVSYYNRCWSITLDIFLFKKKITIFGKNLYFLMQHQLLWKMFWKWHFHDCDAQADRVVNRHMIMCWVTLSTNIVPIHS